MDVYREWLNEGFARAGGNKSLENFDIAPGVMVNVGNDVDECRNAVKPHLALYVGGMGARDRNFYFNLVCRYGYEEAAHKIQDLYLAGRKAEAVAAVPDALVDDVSLCGPKERIAERLPLWRDSGITTLMCHTGDPVAVRTMAELLSADVAEERR
jgi:alkanesulfonate monooxygenase SsuD/methylene tetrahydromethanopterin reductase-like flavin-dependent oxidoreductase (luciferase family)